MIVIAENCGMCVGAKNSVELAEQALAEAEQSGRTVVLFKELLHNPTVMGRLRERGAVCCDSLDGLPDNPLVVVRAHGETKAFYEEMKKRNIPFRDATCPNVRRVHELVEKAHAAGNAVIIFGQPGHPEVEGSNGWCGNQAFIVNDAKTLAALPAIRAEEICVVCQTTAGRNRTGELLEMLRSRMPDARITWHNTICPAPIAMQGPSRQLAMNCDILFTIGGRKSANTTELREYCKAANAAECPEQMETCREFHEYLEKNGDTVRRAKRYGFTAGASTPLSEVRKCASLLVSWLNADQERVPASRMTADSVVAGLPAASASQ